MLILRSGLALARAGLAIRDLTGLGRSSNPLAVAPALLHWATGRMDHDDTFALVGRALRFLGLHGVGNHYGARQTKGPSGKKFTVAHGDEKAVYVKEGRLSSMSQAV